MSVKGWKEETISDDIVWEVLANGKWTGLRFYEEEEFRNYAMRIKPKTIGDIAIALAVNTFIILFETEFDNYIIAREKGINNGPFSELEETNGYPFFKDQIITVIKNRLRIEGDEPYELASDIGKRMSSAEEKLYSFCEVEKETLDNIWKYTPATMGRRYLLHFATAVYEAIWLLNNGAGIEYWKEKPIIIGKE